MKVFLFHVITNASRKGNFIVRPVGVITEAVVMISSDCTDDCILAESSVCILYIVVLHISCCLFVMLNCFFYLSCGTLIQ